MKIVIFAFDVPYPANRGGRADIWRRIQALHNCGFEILLVGWHESHRGVNVDTKAHDALTTYCKHYLLFPIRWGIFESLRRLLKLPFQPSHVSSRDLRRADMKQLDMAVAQFRPDYIWSEGPYPAAVASHFAKKLAVPFYYRSHNIESLYFKRQAAIAKGWKSKLVLALARIGLARFERTMISRSERFYDVSYDDLKYWQSVGFTHGRWLPPIAESALFNEPIPQVVKDLDIVFLGNLRTPNNVAGVEWLVKEVMPLVIAILPETKCVIAGSNATSEMASLLSASKWVEYIPNPPDALAIYRRARVLVNPVFTGSGIHVKALEMLMMDSPIVTRTQGIQGMPDSVKALFDVADDVHSFADKLCQHLLNPESEQTIITDRAEARKLFSTDILKSEFGALSAND